MSIHTILSQMEKEFDKKFVIRTGTKKIKRVGYYCTKDSDSHVGHDPKLILDFFRSFATRIVEEVGKELIGEYEQVEYGGDEFNAPDIDHNAIARNDLRKEQRTKLQEMKEI